MTLVMVMVQSLMCRVWHTSHSDTYSELHSSRHCDTGLARGAFLISYHGQTFNLSAMRAGSSMSRVVRVSAGCMVTIGLYPALSIALSTIYHHPPLFSTRHGPRPACQSAACVGVGGDSIHNADKWADKLCSAGCISQISPYITLYTLRALQPPPPDCARPGGCARCAVRGAWRKQTVS